MDQQPHELLGDRPAAARRLPQGSSTAWALNLPELAAIYEAGVSVCVLARSLEPEVTAFAAGALAGHRYESSLRVRATNPSLGELLPPGLTGPGRERFLEDVAFLIEVYSELFGAEQIGVRLSSLHEAMCPRFHVDRVLVRLVCAYCGPGTEWLDSLAVNRSRLGHLAGGVPDEQSGLLLSPDAISRMPTGAIGLLKGEAWPGNEGRGAVHRSPAVTAAQGRRVLLTLDSLS